MKIRTLTFSFDPSQQPLENTLDTLAKTAQTISSELNATGYEVETLRLATSPFIQAGKPCNLKSLMMYAQAIDQAAMTRGFNYVSLGPALPEEICSFDLVTEILAATQTIFLTGLMTTTQAQISQPAVHACAEIIQRCASITPDGFTNLRFAALGNVPAGAPFFPAAYHAAGTSPACGLGMETAADIIRVAEASRDAQEFRTQLLALFEKTAREIRQVVEPRLDQAGIRLCGFDFSTAPFPTDECSAGGALERLGTSPLGSFGSLSAAAFLADTLGRGKWLRTGLNGLMLPVLEDSILARRSAEGSLTIKDLLLFSAVCGTGLDTVPIPGDVSVESLAALLNDVASLSLRLNKPLTARLMPIPGKKAGDPIHFDFDYFADGAVMALPESNLSGLLARAELNEVRPRE